MSSNTRLPSIWLLLSLCGGSMFMNSCADDPVLPVLTTGQASAITVSSAVITGEVTDDGGADVTARGICWGTTAGPDFTDNFKASGIGTGEFTCSMDGLDPNTMYYARTYAENSVGIAYGNEVSFTTAIGAPAVTTGQVSEVTANSAVCGGTVVDDGGAVITEKGICWSTNPDPDIQDSYTNLSTGAATFSSILTSLEAGTRYYARAYVKNGGGIAYGEQIIFNTKVADIEGNLYSVVYIGDQVWMAENLRTTMFDDSTPIPNITAYSEWINLSGAAYCWYNNDILYKPTLGALYSWYSIVEGKLCPTGWHVPTDAEFTSLELYLGMNPDSVTVLGWRGTDQGSQLKSTTGWDDGGNGTNSTGFTGLPGGYRYAAQGAFYSLGELTYWWAATEAGADLGWYRRFDASHRDIYKAATSKKGGKYIRCLKD